jgi:hypothetical protein
MGSINVESHGFAIFALVNVFGTNVVGAAASETTPLGNENRVQLWRFHGWRNQVQAKKACS